jgi:hypothetical protein
VSAAAFKICNFVIASTSRPAELVQISRPAKSIGLFCKSQETTMDILNSRSLCRWAIMALILLAGAGTFVTAGVEPAMALCKYGTPHCADPHRPTLPSVGGVQFPGSGWVDPDCNHYGNCNSSEVKGTARLLPPMAPVHPMPAPALLSRK